MNEVSKAVARWAAVQPERPAMIDERTTMTYGELHARSNRWVGAIRSAGVQPGQALLLLLPNCAEYIAVLVAAIRSGAAPFVLNHHYTPEDVDSLAVASGAGLLITSRSLLHTEAGRKGPFRKASCPVHFIEDFAPSGYAPSGSALSGVASDVVFFTSGTTGKPKGIVVAQSIFNLALPSPPASLKPQLHLLCRPLFFRAHLTAACHIVQEGHTIVLSRQADPGTWMSLFRRHNISFVSMGPGDVLRLLDHLTKTGQPFPASVRQLMTTGAPLAVKLKRRMKESAPHVRVTDLYGASEVGAIAMIGSDEWEGREASCGRPLFFNTVSIMDENGRELPPGMAGEIWVKSRYRMKRYFQLDESIEEEEAGAGDYFQTGDLGYKDEQGYLYLCGRKQEIINRCGYHIIPSEIENVLREARDVEEAIVIGVEHEESIQEPVVYIRLRDDKHGNAVKEADKKRELLAYCESRLARYKVPAAVLFLNDVPLNAAGKTDRRELARRLTQLKTKSFR